MKNIREEIIFKNKGGIIDLFDDMIKSAFNITDDEYDFICENATDDELNLFLGGLGKNDSEPATFSDIRKSLEVRNKYVEYYK